MQICTEADGKLLQIDIKRASRNTGGIAERCVRSEHAVGLGCIAKPVDRRQRGDAHAVRRDNFAGDVRKRPIFADGVKAFGNAARKGKRSAGVVKENIVDTAAFIDLFGLTEAWRGNRAVFGKAPFVRRRHLRKSLGECWFVVGMQIVAVGAVAP